MMRKVALFTRAWIEISCLCIHCEFFAVALFTRAWIEIKSTAEVSQRISGRPLHEGVD